MNRGGKGVERGGREGEEREREGNGKGRNVPPTLEVDRRHCKQWAAENRMVINILKTKEIVAYSGDLFVNSICK